jgi:hypothetical protein
MEIEMTRYGFQSGDFQVMVFWIVISHKSPMFSCCLHETTWCHNSD